MSMKHQLIFQFAWPCLLVAIYAANPFACRCLAQAPEAEPAAVDDRDSTTVASRMVRRIHLKSVEIAHVVHELRKHGARVCYESVPFTKEDRIVDEQRNVTFYAKKLVSIDARNLTVGQILDEVVAQDSNYGWRQHDDGKVIMIGPKESSLNWNFKTRPPQAFEIQEFLQLIDLKQHGILPSTSGNVSPRSSPLFAKVTLNGDRFPGSSLEFSATTDLVERLPDRINAALLRKKMTIFMEGKVAIGEVEHPFLLTAIEGSPHLLYFRERDGDPLADLESFYLTLIPAHDEKYDLLFIGGDIAIEPFRAYERVAEP